MALSIVSYCLRSLEPGTKGIFLLFPLRTMNTVGQRMTCLVKKIISRAFTGFCGEHLSTTKQDPKDNTGKFLDGFIVKDLLKSVAMTVLHQLNNCVTDYVCIILRLPQELSLAYCRQPVRMVFDGCTKCSKEIPAPYNPLSLGLRFEQTAELILSVPSLREIQMYGQL